MKNLHIFMLVVILLITTSCKVAYRVILGIDSTPEFVTNQQIEKKAKKYGVPKENLFILNPAMFSDSIVTIRNRKIDELEQSDTIAITRLNKNAKNDAQPVQLRYFNSEGQPIFKMVNCYVDPPIPMTWNVQGSLDEFPPKPIDELKPDIDYNLSFFLPLITDREGNKVTTDYLPEAEYYAIVFWNSFFIRPSKKLIRQIRRYNRKKGESKTHFIFVNNHNAHLFNFISDEDKKKVLEEMEKN